MFLKMILFFFLISMVNANSRQCDVQTEFDTCSSNSACGCLPLSNSNSLGVCGLRNASCSDFVECQSPDDTCTQPEHVCISPPRCGSPRLCYPLSMAHQNLCPPSRQVTTTTQSSKIVVTYTGQLTQQSSNYSRAHVTQSGSYYYQAYEIQVATTGTYIFSSSSSISDTYGYLYQGNFYPSYPTYNIITHDDDTAGNRQFQLTANLRSDLKYILIFTTYNQNIFGSFQITVSGIDNVSFKPI